MKKLLALALVAGAAVAVARRPEVKDAVVRAIDDPRFQRVLATARTRASR
ncbi:hypothetical protein [Nocardioides baekrokdamisoli]|nr:hypothetical protein [Nocardioides baekrokdamisoli]